MISRILLSLAICSIAVSAKLCLPDQWQGSLLGKTAQVVKGVPSVATFSGMEYMDFTKKMSSYKEIVMYGDEMTVVTLINDWNKMKTFEINPDAKTCKTIAIVEPQFKQFCEGDEDFKLVNSLVIGGRPAGVYEAIMPNLTFQLTLMKDDFSRVSSLAEQTSFGFPQMAGIQYGNASNQITDEGVFDLPSYCGSREVKKEPRKRVCIPQQLEMFADGKVAQVPNGVTMILPLFIKESRDYKNKMEATASTVVYNGQELRTMMITDWNKRTSYHIDLDKKTCTVSAPATQDMLEACSDSPSLKHMAEFKVIGRMADTYRVDVAMGSSSMLTVFRDTFEFISVATDQNIDNIPQMIALQYGNTTMGIADRSVFDIPSYCK